MNISFTWMRIISLVSLCSSKISAVNIVYFKRQLQLGLRSSQRQTRVIEQLRRDVRLVMNRKHILNIAKLANFLYFPGRISVMNGL
jgi:hypothetical protein